MDESSDVVDDLAMQAALDWAMEALHQDPEPEEVGNEEREKENLQQAYESTVTKTGEFNAEPISVCNAYSRLDADRIVEEAAPVALECGQQALLKAPYADESESSTVAATAIGLEDALAWAEMALGCTAKDSTVESVTTTDRVHQSPPLEERRLVSSEEGDRGPLGGSSEEEACEAALAWAQTALAPQESDAALEEELRQQVEDLQAQLAAHAQRQVQECRSAARGAAEAAEQEFRPEIAAALSLVERLESEASEQEQAIRRGDRRLLEAERLLRTAEGHVQHLRPAQKDEAVAAAGCEDDREACLEIVRARHQEEVTGLEAEVGAAKAEASALAGELQAEIDAARQEVESLNARAKELDGVDHAASELHRQLQLCDGRMTELEAAGNLLQKALAKGDAEVSRLRQQSSALAEAAERGEADLRADLAASLEREQRLKAELEILLQEDNAAEALEAQLDSSNSVAVSLEATLEVLQLRLEDIRQQEASAIPWRAERSDLRTELVALHAAEEEAHERVAQLQSELDALSAEHSASGFELASATADGAYCEEAGGSSSSASLEPRSAPREAERVEALEATLSDVQARLSARERRVQLLAFRFRQAGFSPRGESCRNAEPTGTLLEEQERTAERRASDLQDIVSDLAQRLDQCEKQRSELLRCRRDVDREARERGKHEAEAAEAQRKQIGSLQSSLASARQSAISGSSEQWRQADSAEGSWRSWSSGSGAAAWRGGGEWHSGGSSWDGW